MVMQSIVHFCSDSVITIHDVVIMQCCDCLLTQSKYEYCCYCYCSYYYTCIWLL